VGTQSTKRTRKGARERATRVAHSGGTHTPTWPFHPLSASLDEQASNHAPARESADADDAGKSGRAAPLTSAHVANSEPAQARSRMSPPACPPLAALYRPRSLKGGRLRIAHHAPALPLPPWTHTFYPFRPNCRCYSTQAYFPLTGISGTAGWCGKALRGTNAAACPGSLSGARAKVACGSGDGARSKCSSSYDAWRAPTGCPRVQPSCRSGRLSPRMCWCWAIYQQMSGTIRSSRRESVPTHACWASTRPAAPAAHIKGA